MPSSPGLFSAFASTAEAIGATRKRLEKAACVAAYLQTLDDTYLPVACRLLASQAFASYDARTLRLGSATLLAALQHLSQVPPDSLRQRLVALGDLGDVAAAVLPATPGPADAPVDVLEVAKSFVALSAARKTSDRQACLQALLRRMGAREACYYIRLCTAELRIGLKEGALEDALARLAEVPVAQVRAANMLLGDVGHTALLARHKKLDTARLQLFAPLKFMLASPVETPAEVLPKAGAAHLLEDKYDGIRVQAHLARDKGAGGDVPLHGQVHQGVRVALFSRTMDEVTHSFAELVPPLAELLANAPAAPTALLLDGELLARKQGTVLPFSALQKRLGRKRPSAADIAACPVTLVAFDLLAYADTSLLALPLTERQSRLATLLPPLSTRAAAVCRAPGVTVPSTASVAEVEALFDAARERGHEGLISKNVASPYTPGRRGGEWLKLKGTAGTLDVVVVSAEVGHGRRRAWLSDYTFAVRRSADDATLLTVGKAYSGLTDAELTSLSAFFRTHTTASFAHGKVHTVEPLVVLEVTFDRVQKSARHRSGYALRFPRIVRLRPDKTVADIDTLAAVAKLCSDP